MVVGFLIYLKIKKNHKKHLMNKDKKQKQKQKEKLILQDLINNFNSNNFADKVIKYHDENIKIILQKLKEPDNLQQINKDEELHSLIKEIIDCFISYSSYWNTSIKEIDEKINRTQEILDEETYKKLKQKCNEVVNKIYELLKNIINKINLNNNKELKLDFKIEKNKVI